MCCTKRKNLLVNKMLDHASMTLFNIDETWSPLPRSQWSQIIYEVLCKYFRFHKIFRHRVACKKLWDWNCFSLSLRWLKIPLGPLRSFNLKTSANWEHIKNSVNSMAKGSYKFELKFAWNHIENIFLTSCHFGSGHRSSEILSSLLSSCPRLINTKGTFITLWGWKAVKDYFSKFSTRNGSKFMVFKLL